MLSQQNLILIKNQNRTLLNADAYFEKEKIKSISHDSSYQVLTAGCPAGRGWVDGLCIECVLGYYKPRDVVEDECIPCPDPQSTTENVASSSLAQCRK